MITAKEICDNWSIKPSDYGLLFSEESDYKEILRQTKFIETGNFEFDKKTLLYWWMEVYRANNEPDYEIYHTYSNACYKYLKFLHTGGYNPQTNQSGLKICLNKDSDIDEAIREVELAIPYIIPAKFEDYFGKYFGVFEHTLSQHGVYSAILPEDSDLFILGITRYHHYSELKTFEALEDLLVYIAKNHYYKKKTKT